MRPFDPRLARYARATRAYLGLSTVAGVATVALVIAQAVLLADAITGVFLDGRADLPLLALGAVVAGRALLAWAQEMAAHRASAAVKSQLRERLLDHVMRLGPAFLRRDSAGVSPAGQAAAGRDGGVGRGEAVGGTGDVGRGEAVGGTGDVGRGEAVGGTGDVGRGEAVGGTGDVATLTTRGLDALDTYFARYLPQLVLAAAVPAVVLAWILPVDLLAGLTIAVTLPLIPLFMALVGLSTERLNRRQFAALARLGHHLLELIAGLPTLKVFGRARGQARAIRELTEAQRSLTMRTLRLAFLSSLVLELLATISVALVAVGIGVRVVGGSLDLRTALIVLILAPEAYLPLRALGTQYHAAGEGLAAARRVLDILDMPVRPPGAEPAPPHGPVVVEDASVTYPDRTAPALAPVSLRLEPGETVAVVGRSGAGKSTLGLVLAGLVAPTSGRVLVGPGLHLSDVDPDAWRRRVAYVPQHPYLFAGTVAANIDLAGTHPAARVVRAAREAQLDGLPDGLSTVVGEGGAGLSAGQRRRVALARAFLHGGELVVLDEPTANLDPATEADLVAAIGRLANPRRTVVVIAHHGPLIAAADRVISLDARPVLELAA